MAAPRDPLATYNAKRDFTKTAEPAGERSPRAGNLFIVQKHAARRLHWDLRLEMDGVLTSWAVTRGPSLDPDDKRLAVRTEDHPLSYAAFEGVIPAGEYGGGTVMLWDRGHWEPVEGKSAADLERGHLHVRLHGTRMKGEWLLIRLKPRPREKAENWLLRKLDDAEAGAAGDLVDRCLTSVATGRTMEEIAAGAPARRAAGGAGARRRGNRPPAARPGQPGRPAPDAAPLPAFVSPQLCTLVDHVPTGQAWLHEVKYDGYRCLLAVSGGEARIFTRSGLDWTDRFPGIVAAARRLPLASALIDGEIVALDGEGKPSFSALQAALKQGQGDLVLFAFDLLSLDGEDLTRLGNLERKELLRPLIPGAGAILYADHVRGEGEKLFATMCDAGFEGVVSKRADAPYLGRRTQNWRKVKCVQRQEFVIVGWLPSSTRGRPFRSLLLGLNEEGRLRYAGKVGTGFDAATLVTVAERLAPLAVAVAPVEAPRAAVRGAKWVRPELVAEIAFAEFTADNVVRHASFLGLREDKRAAEPVAERPQPAGGEAAPAVRISNRDRVIYPDAGLTKGDLADYYEAVAPLMMPWLDHRPISLVRCPQGRGKACFFQKHDAGSFGGHVRAVAIREKDGGTEDYLYVDSPAGLLACVQMGTIEFHGWGSRVPAIEAPDRLVFDLDPDEGLGFDAVRRAALDLKRMLGDLGLVSFPLLTGGKGIHVVVPLLPQREWPEVKDFAHRFALALAETEPDRFVATMSKAKRKGRIFIDYLRNQRGATAILPYSARARPNAPVAAPLAWDELPDLAGAAGFTIRDAARLAQRARTKALRGWGRAEQALPPL